MRPLDLPTGLLRRVLLTDRTVLFVCVGNSGRSLMAEAIFNADPAPGWVASSAGTEPALRANPRAASALREIGLELPPHPPRLLTPEMIDGAGVRITMGCLDRASCPARLKSRPLIDWALPDPADLDEAGVREVREEIRRRISKLKGDLSRGTPPS